MQREFEFRFTCKDKHKACVDVKKITKQVSDKFYEVRDIKGTWYDHVAFIKVPTIDDAVELSREIKKRTSPGMTSIIIRAR